MLLGICHIGVTDFLFDFFGDFNDFLSMVSIFRDWLIDSEEFKITSFDRLSEVVPLNTSVIHIVFTGDIISCFLIDTG